jgi:hypothetical protein
VSSGTTVTPLAQAQTARTANVNASTPSATWTESAPMSGSAPSRRNTTCQAPSHPCDDFTLVIDRGTSTAVAVTIDLTPSANAGMSILLYPPGCDSAPSAATCYSVYGTKATLVGPTNGTYLVRMACTSCANATYSAKATLAAFTYNLPATGDQKFAWANQELPVNPTTTSFGEPGISINKLGHVIVNSFGPTVWISTDDGKTWPKPLESVDSTPCTALSGDADAVVSSDDTYYADNLCLPGPTNLSYQSRDGGKTWNASQGNLPNLPGAATDSDRQWYGLDPSDPNVVYFSYHDFAGPNIWVNKSTDHGNTFTQQVPITLGAPNFVDTGPGNTSSRPLVDPSDPNTVIVFYTSNTAIKSATAPPTNQDFDLTQIFIARSTDGGKTWTNTKLYDAGAAPNGSDNTIAHEFSSSAIDSAGNAYVVFSQRQGDGTQTHIRFFEVPKGSVAPVTPVQVDSGGLGANVFPWVAAGDPGRVAITWYGSTAQDNNDINAQWSQMFAQTLNGTAAAPTFTQSRVSGGTPMHAADVCLAGTLCLVTGGNRNLSDFQMVAVDPCGMAEMVWANDAAGGGRTDFSRQTAGPSLYVNGCGGPILGALGPGNPPSAAAGAAGAANAKGNLPATGGSDRTGETGLALLLVAGLLAYARRSPMRRTPRSKSSSPKA